MSDEEKKEVELEFKKSELRYRSDMQLKMDKVIVFIDTYAPLLKMLAEREVDRRALRKAIIEKSLAGLVWAGVVGIATLAYAGFKVEIGDVQAWLKK